jgi:multidrug efflux pump subunit AcrB
MSAAPPKLGAAGRLARAFIHSKLTPLLLVASVVLGAFAVWRLPREEEPQIVVPMSDVFVRLPGASAQEVEQRVTKPLERLLWEVAGVEYVYSTSSPGQALVIVRFHVGQDLERSMVRLREKLDSHLDVIPSGASAPLVKQRSIDDVPILALTLWSERYSGYELRRLASELEEQVKQVAGVSEVQIIGGERRQARVELDPERLAARGLAAPAVARALQAANTRWNAGALTTDNRELIIQTGSLLAEQRDIEDVVVGASGGRPVYLRDVASVKDGPEEPLSYVRFGGGASARGGERGLGSTSVPAVTLSLAKHSGQNAVSVVSDVMDKVDGLRGTLIPATTGRPPAKRATSFYCTWALRC